MTDTVKSNLRGAAFALAAFGIFATHDVIVKYLGAIYAPFQIVFFSVLFGFPLATLMLMRDATSGTLRPVHPWWTALRTCAIVITAACAFYAFSALPLAQVYAILFAAPLLITVLSIPILGERVGAHRWAAVMLGLIGVLVVLRPGTTSLGLGHLAAIVAAVGSALASVVVRKIGRDERSAVLMLYPMVANFAAMAMLMPGSYLPMPIEHLGLVGLISAMGFIAGLCMIAAYRAGDAAIVAPMQYSQMLWAAVFGWVFFSEAGDLWTWTGAGIVIASGLYIVLREGLAGTSRTTPVLTSKNRFDSGTLPRFSLFQRVRARSK